MHQKEIIAEVTILSRTSLRLLREDIDAFLNHLPKTIEVNFSDERLKGPFGGWPEAHENQLLKIRRRAMAAQEWIKKLQANGGSKEAAEVAQERKTQLERVKAFSITFEAQDLGVDFGDE